MSSLGKDLAQSLGEELAAANSLLQLLQQEQTHLVNADIDELAKLTEGKTQLVTRMTELAQNRYRTLAAAGFSAGEDGMQTWAKSPAVVPAVDKSWNDLLSVARQAKEMNRMNGLLIGKHMARNQGALNALQGNQQGAAMYGPDGQAASSSSSRRLVVG